MIRVGIVGISGYSGYALLEILLKHKNVRVTHVAAHTTTGKVEEIWPQLAGRTNLVCEKIDVKKISKLCELVFLAVPHTHSMALTPKFLEAGLRVIDLSGDYRLKSTAIYKQWYDAEHTDSKNLTKAIYGLPEINRERIKNTTLVANPGCYPTAAILALAPIMSAHGNDVQSVIIDAKSGVSGAGKKLSANLMYCEVNENFKAYKVLTHQHSPEIEQYLSQLAEKDVKITFVPHLLPVHSGILETIYVQLNAGMTETAVHSLYKKFYKTESFVRVLPLGTQPELKNVVKTNFCDIGIAVSADKKMLVITSVIDNLIKGAAGQAVQNMNIMYNFSETEGLF